MKNIEEIIDQNRDLITKALDSLLPTGDASHSEVYDAMRYSAMSGGKRIRPTLTLEFCRMAGGDITAAIPYACAVECIHTYSLIHDDLPCMDDDDERRGAPSCHIKYGEANALLAGDALLTYAFAIIADNPFADAERNCRAISYLSACAGYDGMIGGQVCDLKYENKPISFEEMADMERKKTGELIASACLLGLVAADEGGRLPEELYTSARRYAYNIGLAFQIIDDILDSEENGSDEESGKTTVLSFMSVEEARGLAASLTRDAVAEIAKYPNASALVELAVWLSRRAA